MHSLRGALAIGMIGNNFDTGGFPRCWGHASSDTTQAY